MRWGPPSVRTQPAAVRTGGLPPNPHFTREGHFGWAVRSGGKIKICFRPILGPQGPFSIKICERLLLSYTAWCVPTCLVRRWSYKGAQQLLSCHGYARAGGEISTQNAANFGLGRPQWAEARRTQGLVFGAAGRKCLSSRMVSPVKRGSGGGATWNARLRRGVPRRHTPSHSLVPFW